MISYEPFFEYLKKKNISQYELLKMGIVSNALLNSLKHNNSITMSTLNNLCNQLNCKPEDIFIYHPDQT